MSELKVEDLKKLSVAKLTEYIKGLEGEDKVLAENVLKSKLSRNEQLADMPGVAAEKETSEEVNADVEKRRAEREAARLAKEEEKNKLAAERAEKAKQREELRVKAFEEKLQAAAKKEEMKNATKEQREALAIEKEELRKAKAVEKEAIFQAKMQQFEEKKAAENARVAAVAEALKNNPDVNVGGAGKEGKKSKTAEIKELMAQGFTNPEIAKATGYGIKFVCDTAWRINKEIEKAEFVAKYMAERQAKIDSASAEKTE